MRRPYLANDRPLLREIYKVVVDRMTTRSREVRRVHIWRCESHTVCSNLPSLTLMGANSAVTVRNSINSHLDVALLHL